MFKTLSTFFGPVVAIETDIRIAQEIDKRGHWEFQETLEILAVYDRHYQNPTGTMLDIGCNIGTWTLPLAQRYSQNTILAFDCQQPLVDCVCQTVDLNRLTNVKAYCAAVSDRVESRTYNKLDYHWGGNLGAYEFEPPHSNSDFNGRTTTETDTVSVITVDSLNLDSVVFMKLDVEGMEYQALVGAKETIQRCRPFITFEHHKTDRASAEEFCRSLDYRLLNTVGQMTVAVPNYKQ